MKSNSEIEALVATLTTTGLVELCHENGMENVAPLQRFLRARQQVVKTQQIQDQAEAELRSWVIRYAIERELRLRWRGEDVR